MSPESTKMLVEQAQAGDTNAFEALVNQYYSMVHGLALSRVNDWAAADDLAQDVFLVAWTNLSRLRAPGAFLVWLRRIARNASLNFIRARDYRRRLADRQVEQHGTGTPVAIDPSATASRQECFEQVRAAIDSLSPKLREAMVLFYLEGQTAAAAAESLDISVDTMKKRLRLARAKLQRYYEGRHVKEIEQLLPHNPRRRIEQIVAGLFIGPVMPDWAAKVAAKSAAGTAGTLTSAASVGAICMGAAASMAVLAGGIFHWQTPTATEHRTEAHVIEMESPETAHHIDGAVTGRFLRVQDELPAAQPDARGLQPEDVITEVNGRPVSDLVKPDGQSALSGVPGAPVRVTYIPAEGEPTPRAALVVWPFLPKQFKPAS